MLTLLGLLSVAGAVVWGARYVEQRLRVINQDLAEAVIRLTAIDRHGQEAALAAAERAKAVAAVRGAGRELLAERLAARLRKDRA